MTRRGWVLFALMCVLWGIPYMLIKIAVDGVSNPVLVFARTAVGAAVLVPLAARIGGLDRLRRHWRPLALFAVIEIVVPWWLISDAERHLTSSMTGLLIAAVPVTGVVLARMTGSSERLNGTRWLGLSLGLAGVVLLAAPHLEGGSMWPVLELILVVFCYATGPLIVARRLGDVPSLLVTAACLTLAALAYTPAAIITAPNQLPSVRVLAALAGLAVLCTAVAFVVFFELINEVGPSRALVFTYVNPAVAVAAGILVLDEPLTAIIIVSFALILAGSVLATAPRSTARAPAG